MHCLITHQQVRGRSGEMPTAAGRSLRQPQQQPRRESRHRGGRIGGGRGITAVGGVPKGRMGVRGVQRGDRIGTRRVRAALRPRIPLGLHLAVAAQAQHLPLLQVRAPDRRRVLRN